ncbi:MAG: hypothetical protein K6E17_09225 [Clostridiales bacterium]|nr:hypothetical protein [Clostridiales bacterium]
MKKILGVILLAAALTGLGAAAHAEEAAAPEEKAEWTVMFYFCGSDLESKYGYASESLEEIWQVFFPDSLLPLYGMENLVNPDTDWNQYASKSRVNVLAETGGSSRWHTAKMGQEIRTDVLQRWRYHCYSTYSGRSLIEKPEDEYELLENCPLESMASPETLADFIRWGAKTCPAEKYALVLWDHGGGAMTGLFADELFDGDIMNLNGLHDALEGGGVQLEALVIDACLMANIETAWAVRDFARWMIASEELAPGHGTAVEKWLQELYNHPECDGKQLGRTICDLTLNEYASSADETDKAILTWSVIDLSAVERLADSLDRYFGDITKAFQDHPMAAINYAKMFHDAEEYGDGTQQMRDLASVFYHENAISFMDAGIRNDFLDAYTDAVVYCVRGPAHSAARGLSFCYPVEADAEDLDLYAQNCPFTSYLAYLDAISDWVAPEWVYEKAERIPEIRQIPDYQLTAVKCLDETGFPAFMIENMYENLSGTYYSLYYLDEESGGTVFLGRTDCKGTYFASTDYTEVYSAFEPWMWPSANGIPCTLKMQKEQYNENGKLSLYSIPIRIGTSDYFLRCGRQQYYRDKSTEYEIYGAWKGKEDGKLMQSRGLTSLAQLAGRDYRILWPLDGADAGEQQYVPGSSAMWLPRMLEIEEKPLPAGTYYLQYEADDMFMRPYTLERIEMHWDGESLTFPEDFAWEGRVALNWEEP